MKTSASSRGYQVEGGMHIQKIGARRTRGRGEDVTGTAWLARFVGDVNSSRFPVHVWEFCSGVVL